MTHSHACSVWRCSALVFLVAGLGASVVHAQPVLRPAMLQARLPERANTVSRHSGLSIEVTDDGLGSGQFGYRRVYFTVKSPKPATSDTKLTVRVFVSDWNIRHGTTQVEVDGELPSGKTSTTLVARIPQSTQWNFAWWTVWVDGVNDPALSKPRDYVQPLNDSGFNRWDNDYLFKLTPSNSATGTRASLANLQGRASGRSMLAASARLSDNWLDYTPFDIVELDLAEMRLLAKDDPSAAAALKQWVHAGGTLWLLNTGDDWNALGEVHELFGWAPTSRVEPVRPSLNTPASSTAWSYVNLRRPKSTDREEGLVQDFGQLLQSLPTDIPELLNLPVYSEDWFVVRRYGWGTVAAFAEDEPAGRSGFHGSELATGSAYWSDKTWPLRHGNLPGYANGDFSNWLIPGVGLAPVVSFQVLITLFVLGIGPLNYWLLKRAGRLQLMVVTVPLAAVVITGGLLAYGLLSDGLSTKVRMRTITLLDGGKGTTWSRLSYYAAFAPRDGLHFEADTAVYPILPGSVEAYDTRGGRAHRKMEWVPDEQRLTQGWLASRTPTQYFTINPQDIQAPIDIQYEPSGGEMRNGFQSRAELIVAVDEQGEWRMAEGVAVDGTAALTPVTKSEAVRAVRDLLSDREPEFPLGFEATTNTPLLYEQQRRRRRYYRRNNLDYGLAGASQSLLQRRWTELLGLGGTSALDLPPQSYLVISDRALVPISRDDFLVEDSSVHLVIGTW